MATFKSVIPGFSAGGFFFKKGVLSIANDDPALARWRAAWAKLPAKYGNRISEVTERDRFGRLIGVGDDEGSGIRGVTGSRVPKHPVPGAMAGKPESMPDAGGTGTQEPTPPPTQPPQPPQTVVPPVIPVIPVVAAKPNPFDHDGDGKAGGSKPLPKAGEPGFIDTSKVKI